MLSTPTRLKTTEVSKWRTSLLLRQGGRCAVCKMPCSEAEAVLDHDHSSGAVRAVLHRGCNALLGKVENNYKRYGVKNLHAFCNGLAQYFTTHTINITGLLHPTHKSEDEKRVARNTAARKARALKKAP